MIDEKIATSISPIWDETTQSISFIDLTASAETPSIYWYSLNEEKLYKARVEGALLPVGFVTPIQGHSDLYTVGIGHDAYIIQWDRTSLTAKTVKKLYSVDSLNLNSRTDVARPDRFGHLYGGTFAYTFCIATNDFTVYEYNSGDDGVNVVSDNVYTTSGIAFDEEAELLFSRKEFKDRKIE